MTDTDPGTDRYAYSRTALARLALSHELAGLADRAAAGVPTVNDAFTNPGESVGDALHLVELAQEVLARAVVYERQRGASWEKIGEQLDVARQSAHERYREAEEEWGQALVEPLYPAEPGRRVRGLRLHEAAYEPTKAGRRLDQWAREHVDQWASAHGKQHRDDEHPVTGRLPHLTTAEEMVQVMDAINLLHRTHAGPAKRAEVMERKAALLDRIAVEDGKPEAAQQAAEARAYAAQLRAEAEAEATP
ncbi:hypothetical protein ACGF07_32030 [Kitasatospora sp. NPDC048194]|uniref:hypothetical protein n=1 Tax=Kitasatospora sp. NPDC048194 TaxID=3364045 RepID=UPI003721D048